MQDFPVFLAHCHHKLPGNTFTAVRAVYDGEVHLADQWLTRRGLAGHTWTLGSPGHTRILAACLTFHLRDHRIGPALVRLRGIQTALFFRGYLLRWQYETLGAGPTTRLLSQLTARVCDKLRTAATIEDAAATALSIHLRAPRLPPPAGRHRHRPAVRPRPGSKSPEPGLREAVVRTCYRIHFNPAWLHRSHCRHGDEDQRDAQQAGWMHHRGLDLTALSDPVRSRL
ncbi:hypothetical protein [Streptomyces goshikiensis]|uniref:hypothetical protein n=1 Tax=Streptomyces goshikiensis TaxID=1942 RepID=UPI0036856D2E